jgi:predicted  nucleic acid-binding Zn-ribbon protein
MKKLGESTDQINALTRTQKAELAEAVQKAEEEARKVEKLNKKIKLMEIDLEDKTNRAKQGMLQLTAGTQLRVQITKLKEEIEQLKAEKDKLPIEVERIVEIKEVEKEVIPESLRRSLFRRVDDLILAWQDLSEAELEIFLEELPEDDYESYAESLYNNIQQKSGRLSKRLFEKAGLE